MPYVRTRVMAYAIGKDNLSYETTTDKDVVRTDRHLDFFKDTDGPQLKQLNDILVTYTFFNFDLGILLDFLKDRGVV